MSDNFVQSSTGTGTTTAVATLNGVVAGNTLVALIWTGNSAAPTTHTVADGQGSYASGASASSATDTVFGQVLTLQNANSGTHAATVTFDSGLSADIFLIEVGSSGSSVVSDTKAQFQSAPGTGTDGLSSTTLTISGAATVICFSADTQDTNASSEPDAGTGFTTRVNNVSTNFGAYRMASKALAANAAATFTATGAAGTHRYVTLGAAILNIGSGGAATASMGRSIWMTA